MQTKEGAFPEQSNSNVRNSNSRNSRLIQTHKLTIESKVDVTSVRSPKIVRSKSIKRCD